MSQSGAAALILLVRLFLPDAPELQVPAADPAPERSDTNREVLAHSKFNFV